MPSNAQSFSKSLKQSGQRISTRRLVTSMFSMTIGLGVRTTSALRGSDVNYVNNSRPLTPRRRLANGAALAFTASAMAANAYWLLQRRDPGVAAKAGPEYADTSTLVGNVVGSMLTLGLGARALTKGTSLVRKYPTSRVGTAITTIGMVSAVDLGVESGRELYRRRETIMPGIKTLWSNLVPAQPQLSNKDIDRLLMEYYSRNAAQNPGPQDAKF